MTDSSLHLSDPAPQPRRFASKVDWWLATLLLLPMALIAAFVLPGMFSTTPSIVLLVLLPQVIVVWILGRTFYIVDVHALVVRSGPFRWSVPLTSIRSLSATRSPQSAPALSLDRIAVHHTGGTLLVSPRNRAGFVRTVVAGAPHAAVSKLPGSEATGAADEPESSFSIAAIAPAIVIGVLALGFGAWEFYAGTRPPVVTVSRSALSISGLYSTTVGRGEVLRITLDESVHIGRRLYGFGGGRQLRGFFDVEGLGRSRVFAARGASACLVIVTRTEPLVICLDEPSKTAGLHQQLVDAWGLAKDPGGEPASSP